MFGRLCARKWPWRNMRFSTNSARFSNSVLWCGIAAGLALIGSFVGAAVCVLILFEYTGLPAWVCAAIVSVVLLGGAWGFAVAGWGVAKSVHVIPLRTVRTLVDDAKWMTEWVRTRFT